METLATRFDENANISLEVQTKIVQVITLCSSENPERRHSIGKFQDSVVLKAVLSLLDEEKDSVTAVVGDAIWILSFADFHNHDFFVKNAIEKMGSILVDRVIALENEEADDVSAASLAVMWMAAALQNLAASYCDTESAHCWWEYEHPEEEQDLPEGEETEYGLYLHEDSPLEFHGEYAAEAIVAAASGELVKVLHRLVCAEPMTEDDEAIWASEATIEGAGSANPRIMTWAVAGVLKNLSMYEHSYDATFNAKDCLCALTESADWLESSKAGDALHRAGFVAEDCWGHEEL